MQRSLCALLFLSALVATTIAEQPASAVWSYPPELPGARVEVYKQIDDVELKLFIFQPPDAKPTDKRPAVVFFFGGGWRAGTPGQFYQHCLYLASRGVVGITADYRVLSRHGVIPQQCVADAKSAIRWVRQHAAELGVDPNRIVASGGSAGGHLAACTGIVPGFEEANEDQSISSVPNAMVLFNPAVMLAEYAEYKDAAPIATDKLAGIRERTEGRPEEISPIHHVRSGLPPTLILHGTNDSAVPYPSVELFTAAMLKAGNFCRLVSYANQPHGFFNTGRKSDIKRGNSGDLYRSTISAMDGFLHWLGYVDGTPTIEPPAGPLPLNPNIHQRGELQNARIQFTQQRKGHVAFLGGSITEMEGYRPIVCEILKQRFPETEFTFTNAGISSTCSTTGAFRLSRDVLSQGPVDLLFVEFAVNDDQDAAHSHRECIRGLEGIIRQLREHNPCADVVVTYFVNEPMLETIQQGDEPLSSQSHEEVAEHYGVSSVHLAREVAQRIEEQTLTWSLYGGVHPKLFGNHLCAALIDQLMQVCWAQPLSSAAGKQAYPLPEQPLDAGCYSHGRFVDIGQAKIVAGWQIETPDWKSIPGSWRTRYRDIPLLSATKPGAELNLQFEGTSVGAFLLAGPDAGTVSVSVDGSQPQPVDLYHRFSKNLHYPRTVMFATDLSPGVHTLKLTIAAEHHEESTGTAARIMQFTAN